MTLLANGLIPVVGLGQTLLLPLHTLMIRDSQLRAVAAATMATCTALKRTLTIGVRRYTITTMPAMATA